jgi:hypothetical protein
MKLQRWTARPQGTTKSAADRAGALLRQAAVRQPLDASALAEIRSRLPDERRAPPRHLALRLGLAIALFLAGGGVVLSATLLTGWAPFRRAPAPAVPASPTPARHHAAVRPATPVPAAALEAPAAARALEPAAPIEASARAEAAPALKPAAPDEASARAVERNAAIEVPARALERAAAIEVPARALERAAAIEIPARALERAAAPTALPLRSRAPLARAEAAEPPADDVAPPEVAAPVPAPTAPALAPSAIAEEAALVGAALRRLRESDDAAGALALLDERERRFGAAGTLGDEARTTRVEALLRLGQRGRALALLDATSPRAAGRGRAVLATRGELRADAGRCREADADFDALLADRAASDAIAERALYGRAACRVLLGESNAARADLEAYLARFPGGRFAVRARAALDR